MQVAAKYAKLLFDEASEAKATDKIFRELSAFHEAICSKPELPKALASPVEKDKIEQLIAKVSLKFKFSNLVSNFMQLAVRMQRLKLLPDILDEYQRLMDSMGNMKIVQLSSAREMDKKDQGLMHKMLVPHFGDNIVVKYSVDSSIIGGVVASCNSLVLDASVKGAMDRVYFLRA